jgi:cytochrome c-type biogenesis protein
MHHFFHNISYYLTNPISTMMNEMSQFPILFALLVGMVGTLAPCQLTGNIGAITLYGNQSIQKDIAWKEAGLFILGKIVVYSLIGILLWLLGQGISQFFVELSPMFRKLMGPLLIVIGLYLMGLLKINWKLPKFKMGKLRDTKLSAFFMGVFISLGFCPTMFFLFFLTLIPVVLSTSYGFILPSVFAIGTSIPLLIVLVFIALIGRKRGVMKKGRRLGAILQFVSGWLLFIVGTFDTLTYWF